MTRPEPAAQGASACADVTAVVVTFNPALDALRELLTQIRSQVGRVVVVDNGSDADVARALPAEPAPGTCGIEIVRNGRNLGIAAAQNIGMGRALEPAGCAYILLLDGDSLPAPGMVVALRAAIGAYAGPAPVAAAGPVTIDLRTGHAAALVLDNNGRRERRPALPTAAHGAAPVVHEAAFLIASGSLIPVPALRALGGMRSNYFIDHVDTEWCFRARAAGYRLLLVADARLHHRLGESVRRIRLLPSWPVPYHSPLRDYYAFRNTVFMLRDTAISVHWRFSQLLRLARFAAYYVVLGDLRAQRVRHMWLGIRHGLGRVSGRLVAGTSQCEAIPVTPLDPGPRS